MKYLIVANGPFLPKSIILEAASNATIIALDGAFHSLNYLNIQSDWIIGDFDSLILPIPPQHKNKFISIHNQNLTDFQKALIFCKEKNASSIHVVCALGGRMDHTQAALLTLQNAYNKSCPIYLHTEYHSLWIASNETITIQGRHHDYCGLFGAPYATMSVKNGGLEYGGLESYELSSSQYSSSNRLIGNNNAIVEITGHALIVHPPMLQAQRIFSQKSRVEQLTELLLQEGIT